MIRQRSAYELRESQVTTPPQVISLFWRLTSQYRETLGAVLDLGAGDCRFAVGGSFDHYTGIEIDRQRVRSATPPRRGRLVCGCAFRHSASGYGACIGNPPYVRHHDIRSPWKEHTIGFLQEQLNVSLNKHCNLYLYFLCLALLKTSEKGLVALVIPYEWVSRPSARPVRSYIQQQSWNVGVYRFQMPIFDGVLTTASISIIDKSGTQGIWSYFDITPEFEITERRGVTNSRFGVLDYGKRGKIWALRGLSPGSQEIFTLTEGERVRNGLSRKDVVPCVTSLRRVPRAVRRLSDMAFEKYLVRGGEKCWLIKSYQRKRSDALDAYLQSIPEKTRENYTCQNQFPWFNFKPHPIPLMLFSSGFTEFGPKVLTNVIGATAVGSVLGIHSPKRIPLRSLQNHLLRINFERRVVAHAKKLKKVEVKQLNTVLNAFVEKEKENARKASRSRKGR